MTQPTLTIMPVPNLPMVSEGDDLAALFIQALEQAHIELQAGDILVVAQKIVSKSEGRCVDLAEVSASPKAIELAKEVEKDPRIVELILSESEVLMRKKPGILIMRHKLGLVGAHAGIDQSNIDHGQGECALLLPLDPDKSAQNLKDTLETLTGLNSSSGLGVIISDSMNRPWRLGTVGCAIGSAGVSVLDDQRGGKDIYQRELIVTLINRADAIATAATLIMGETTEKVPLVIIRGFELEQSTSTAQDIIRPLEEDLFL
ncbi:MAG: coenzyme F420-0:L-glutamate ligase [Pseudomonadales bacterium]|nr:coenzyme F420-0:L-glutamate ligase [Pseudomonadales bacterium]